MLVVSKKLKNKGKRGAGYFLTKNSLSPLYFPDERYVPGGDGKKVYLLSSHAKNLA